MTKTRITIFDRIMLVYIFLISIPYNIEWFYITGSFAYADLMLPIMLIYVSVKKVLKFDSMFFCLYLLVLISLASALKSNHYLDLSVTSLGYPFRAAYFAALYLFIYNSKVKISDVTDAIMYSLFVTLLFSIYIWTMNPRYYGYTNIPMLHVLDSATGLKINRNQTGLSSVLLFTLVYFKISFGYLKLNIRNAILLVISFLAILFSFSKGAWALGIIGFIGVTLIQRKNRGSFTTYFSIFGGSIAILTLIILQIDLFDIIDSRFTNSRHTNLIRVQYVLDALSIGLNNPMLGIGSGNYFEYSTKFHYLITLDPHNSYLQAFAELGILALIIVCYIYIKPILTSYKKKSFNNNYSLLFIILLILAVDGFQSGLSLSMKLIYILSALSLKRYNEQIDHE